MQARRWHNSYPPGVPFEIELPRDRTLVTLLGEGMRKYAGRPAVSCGSETLRYSDVDTLSHAFAAWLQSNGYSAGNRVALITPSSPAFIVALVGTLRAGMTVVTVNPLYTPREMEHQLADSGAVVAVACDAVLPTLQAVLARTAVRRVITSSSTAIGSVPTRLARHSPKTAGS